MNKDYDLTKKIRGFNVEQVTEYLESLKQIHKEELDNLKKQLETSYKEKDRLYQKLTELQAEKETKRNSKELLELALIRAKEAVSFFDSKAEEESEEILRAARQQNEIYEKKINDIDNDIKTTMMHVESLLHDMMKILQDSKSEKEKEKEKEETATGKVVGKIFPVSSKLRGSGNNGTTSGDGKEALDEKSKNKAEEKESIGAENEQRMTADGSVITDLHYKRFVEKMSGTPSDPDTQKENQLDEEPDKEKAAQQLDEGFWEDCCESLVIKRETSFDMKPVIEISSKINYFGPVKTQEVDILAAVQETSSCSEAGCAVEELLGDKDNT